jgi:hypothetical protein
MVATYPRVVLTVLLAGSVFIVTGCSDDAPDTPLAPSPLAVPPPPPPPPPPTTPAPSSRTITGRVHEAGGGPVAGVTVEAWGPGGPVKSSTSEDGKFRIEKFDGQWLAFKREGYSSTSWHVPAGAEPDESFEIDVPLQPALAALNSVPLVSTITSDDVTYSTTVGDAFADGEYACGPCKLIAIPAGLGSSSGTFRLTWSGDLSLSLWVGPGGGWNPPILITARPAESEIAVTVNEPQITSVLVGVNIQGGRPRPAGRSAFTLTVESR